MRNALGEHLNLYYVALPLRRFGKMTIAARYFRRTP